MKPLIAIACKHRDAANEIAIGIEYNMAVLENGGIPVMLTSKMGDSLLDEMLHDCGGLLLPGGNDIDPALYGFKHPDGETPVPFDRKQDSFDIKLTQLALLQNMPIFAIGRGMQLINVILGGTLYQDLNLVHSHAGIHQSGPDGYQQMHRVILRNDTCITGLLGKEILTNSDHHQAVCDLGGNLVVSGMSTDGVIESLEYCRKDRWIVGVQWHPERSNITSMKPLLTEFIHQAALFSEEKL